jgi:sensor histidine kinase regulating citrate/malate metabolism
MHGWSITRRLFLAHCVFIAVFTVLVGTAAYVDARDRGYSQTAERMLSVAIAIADNPLVVIAAQSSDPSAALQGYARTVSERADIDVISVLSPAGVRWTHPDETRIGESHPGQVAAAAGGRAITEISPGIRGPTVRALVPIHDSNDSVVGLVAAEVETSTLQIVLDARLPAILALALALLLAGALAIWHLSRHLRRVTHGWGPQELARQFQNTESALQAAGEGLVLVDRRGLLVLCNDRAAELLGIQPRPGPRAGSTAPALTDLHLPAGVGELLTSGRRVQNEVLSIGGRVLLVSQEPAVPATGRVRTRSAPLGTVSTLRDAMAVGVWGIDDPVIGALVLAKIRRALAAGLRLTGTVTGSLSDTGLPVQDLVAEIGTLLDIIIDSAAGAAATGAAPEDLTVGIRTDPEAPAIIIEVTGGAAASGLARTATIPLPPAPGTAPVAAPAEPAPDVTERVAARSAAEPRPRAQ